MTPDASLPPADVQRPTPPLTEEDLAEKPPPTIYDVAGMLCEIVASQRADLRASRAKEAAWAEAAATYRSEVERLRAWIEFTGEHQPTEDDFAEALEWVRQLRQARA